ncbi:MAG: acyltransferase family protein [Acidimicrobiales bacterium]
MSTRSTVVSGPAVAREGRYQPALDGLRAFAVIGAMTFHANILKGGFLGVDLFFVLSGYLITGLLLTEGLGRRTISLAEFYTRRFRRLAPALTLVLVFALVWTYLSAPAAIAPTAASQVGWSVVYLNNWYALFGHVGYWGSHTTILPLGHLWSLAIEEQFYVLWPVVLLLMIRFGARLRHFLWVAGGLAILSAGRQWWVADQWGASRAYLGTDTRFTALAIGATITVLIKMSAERTASDRPASAASPGAWVSENDVSEAFWRDTERDRVRHRHARHLGSALQARLWAVGVLGSTAFLALSWATADLTKTSLFHGWLAACSVAAAVLIAAVATNPSAWYARLLSLHPLVWIGKRSYSLYLWHFPIWIIFNGTSMHNSGFNLWAVRLFLTVTVSMASYAYVEQPIRRSTFSGVKMGLSLGPLGAGLAALVIVTPPVLPAELGSARVVLGVHGGVGSTRSLTGAQSAAGPTPAAAAPQSLRILVAGDSWARNMGYGLTLADSAQHNTVIDLGIPGCGLLTPDSTGCSTQTQSWQHSLANDHPDVALLMEGTFDAGAAEQHGGPGAACASAYEAHYTRALGSAIATLHASGLPVFVTTDRDSEIGDIQSTDCINQMIRAAAQRDSAQLFDIHSLLCPAQGCVTDHAGQAVYDDTGHLALGGQRWIGALLLSAFQVTVKPVAANAQPAPAGPCQTDPSRVKPVRIASYAASPAAPYTDSPDHSKLIDGLRGKPTFVDPAWMGFHTTSTSIVETLASPAPVCAATSTWLQNLGGAVAVPTSIDVYVSNVAGQLGEKLGSVDAPAIGPDDQTSTLTVTGSQPVTGQFVTMQINSIGDFAMTEEVSTAALTTR